MVTIGTLHVFLDGFKKMTVVSGLVFWLLSFTWLLLVGSIVFGVFNLRRNETVLTYTKDTLKSPLNSLVISTKHTTANNLTGTGAMNADAAVIASADVITLKVNTPFLLPNQRSTPNYTSLRLATGGAFELLVSNPDDTSDGVGISQVLLARSLLTSSFGWVDGNSSIMTIFSSDTAASVFVATLSPGNWLLTLRVVATQKNANAKGVQEFAIGLLPNSSLDVYSDSGYAVAGITLDATIPSVNKTVYASVQVDETSGNKYVALQVVKASFGGTEVFSWTVNQLVVQIVKIGL
jgi:hypothetical protein